jgi:hypothetical protein
MYLSKAELSIDLVHAEKINGPGELEGFYRRNTAFKTSIFRLSAEYQL